MFERLLVVRDQGILQLPTNMLNILLRRVDFVLQERAEAANAAVPDTPVAPRAATPAFPSAGAGPVPAHW
eukprot:15808182-Heterocapsa_arctica.AAC.1